MAEMISINRENTIIGKYYSRASLRTEYKDITLQTDIFCREKNILLGSIFYEFGSNGVTLNIVLLRHAVPQLMPLQCQR